MIQLDLWRFMENKSYFAMCDTNKMFSIHFVYNKLSDIAIKKKERERETLNCCQFIRVLA